MLQQAFFFATSPSGEGAAAPVVVAWVFKSGSDFFLLSKPVVNVGAGEDTSTLAGRGVVVTVSDFALACGPGFDILFLQIIKPTPFGMAIIYKNIGHPNFYY